LERATLHTYTIGSYQTPKAERMRQRKEKQRLAEEDRRRAAGAKPREQYLAAAVSRTKPWEAAGFRSRRTWERHGKPLPQLSQVRAQDSYCTPCHGLASLSDVTIGAGAQTRQDGGPLAEKATAERKITADVVIHPPRPDNEGRRVVSGVVLIETVRHAPGLEADAMALAMSVRGAIHRAVAQAG
jgi:hypothetical protein